VKVRIALGGKTFEAELFDTPTARAVAEVLPLEIAFQASGEEISFSLPMQPQPLEEESGAEAIAGEIAYWPQGNVLAIFLGPLGADSGSGDLAPVPVNRVGRILGDPSRLRDVTGSPTLRIEPA
jgi:hypothetical protein